VYLATGIVSIDESERSVEEASSAHGHGQLVDGSVSVALSIDAGKVRGPRYAAGPRAHVGLWGRGLLRCGVGLPVTADDAVVLVAEDGHGEFLFLVC
jgi:hypothetical protein